MTVLAVAAVAAGLLGVLIGSFLNVVVHRVPLGRSVVSPPSACPACGTPVRPRDNVPVVSWLLLRRRCRDCSEPISARYPAVELATGLAFAAVAALAWRDDRTLWVLPALLYLVAASIALTLIDVDVRRLPDAIVLPSYVVVLVLLAGASVAEGDWWPLARAALAGAAAFAAYFALVLVYPAGMGFGDVKLAGVLGLVLGWYGWSELVVGLFLGFLLGGLVGTALLALRLATRKSMIPFGPYMIAGAWVALLAGRPLAEAYLGLTGLS